MTGMFERHYWAVNRLTEWLLTSAGTAAGAAALGGTAADGTPGRDTIQSISHWDSVAQSIGSTEWRVRADRYAAPPCQARSSRLLPLSLRRKQSLPYTLS